MCDILIYNFDKLTLDDKENLWALCDTLGINPQVIK